VYRPRGNWPGFLLSAVGLSLLLGPDNALATFAWTGSVGYGDSSTHTWWDGSETHQADLNMYAPVVNDIMQNQYGPTDLQVLKVGYHLSGTSNYVDV
jgi:hypothetical protein